MEQNTVQTISVLRNQRILRKSLLLLAFPAVADDVDTANVTVAFCAFIAVVTVNFTVAEVPAGVS